MFSISRVIFLIWSTYVSSVVKTRNMHFSRLRDFDNKVPVSPSMVKLQDVSNTHCAAVCAQRIFCRIYFYNTYTYVCNLYDVYYSSMVYENHSLSFQKGCKVGGFTSHYGMCFMLSEYSLQYMAAKTVCDNYNSTLVILDRHDKLRLMLQYLADNGKTYGYFIGLSDRITEGVWLWENSKPVDLTLFLPSQPNDLDGYPGYTHLGADCGSIYWQLVGIGDNYCGRPEHFICEEIYS